jgi:protein gp37
MSDLFHEDVPVDFRTDVWLRMTQLWRHTFQVLTKRPERAFHASGVLWTDNIHFGVTAENQEWFEKRVRYLLRTPAAVRFVSLEPLLGRIETLPIYLTAQFPLTEQVLKKPMGFGGLDWVIVGGESGPGARPMHPNWVRDIRDQCVEAGVPFFFKGWGAWLHSQQRQDWGTELISKARTHDWSDGTVSYRIGKKAAGRVLDGREWSEFPEVTG